MNKNISFSLLCITGLFAGNLAFGGMIAGTQEAAPGNCTLTYESQGVCKNHGNDVMGYGNKRADCNKDNAQNPKNETFKKSLIAACGKYLAANTVSGILCWQPAPSGIAKAEVIATFDAVCPPKESHAVKSLPKPLAK